MIVANARPSSFDFDGNERCSRTDSLDLAAKETIDVYFDTPDSGGIGVAIACRQSLLTTYLFYQTLAYMGSHVGDWLAQFERNQTIYRETVGGVENLLGGIEIMVEDANNQWVSQGTIKETGPLAS